MKGRRRPLEWPRAHGMPDRQQASSFQPKKKWRDTMAQEMRKEQPENRPLSTSTLAHADERSTAENRAAERVERRGPDPALRETERPPADGGPSLVAQAAG